MFAFGQREREGEMMLIWFLTKRSDHSSLCAVFVKFCQMHFSRAAQCISHHLISIFLGQRDREKERERDDVILIARERGQIKLWGARTFLPSPKSRAVRWYGAAYNQGCQRIGQKQALKLALKSPRKNWVVSGAKKGGREMWTWVSSHAHWICLFISLKKSCWGG